MVTGVSDAFFILLTQALPQPEFSFRHATRTGYKHSYALLGGNILWQKQPDFT